jgi:hypothetical protein
MTKTENKKAEKATPSTPKTTKIAVGSTFGYREVVEVTADKVVYVNLNGRKNASGKKMRKELPRHEVSIAAFRKLARIA